MSKSSKQSHLNTAFEHFQFIHDNFNFLIGCISASGAKPGDVISCLLYHIPRSRAILLVRVQIIAHLKPLVSAFISTQFDVKPSKALAHLKPLRSAFISTQFDVKPSKASKVMLFLVFNPGFGPISWFGTLYILIFLD